MVENNPVQKSIGRRIQHLRKEKGYTQQHLAELVGLSSNYLSDIERGKSFPSSDKLVAIINALECSADDVFADVTKFGYKVKASRLCDKIEELPSKEQEKALAILDILNGKHIP